MDAARKIVKALDEAALAASGADEDAAFNEQASALSAEIRAARSVACAPIGYCRVHPTTGFCWTHSEYHSYSTAPTREPLSDEVIESKARRSLKDEDEQWAFECGAKWYRQEVSAPSLDLCAECSKADRPRNCMNAGCENYIGVPAPSEAKPEDKFWPSGLPYDGDDANAKSP